VSSGPKPSQFRAGGNSTLAARKHKTRPLPAALVHVGPAWGTGTALFIASSCT
jgi:hypothetical protein